MNKLLDAKDNLLKTLDKNKVVTMYVCGPTVYNDPHIGNIRPLLTFDVLYRLLKLQGYKIHYVHNITDIDDKIIERANVLNVSEQEITTKYTKEYLAIMEAFNAYIPEIHKVSDEIDDIIDFINKLINNKYAYIVDNDVYFDVKKVKNYGEISHNKLSDLISNVRIENEKNKKDSLDFVLWKSTNQGLRWKAPWSEGRPGWHTECVVMINKYLGEQISIHGGGIDLKFPHHENENAQNYGVNNTCLADIFAYVGHLTINNQKMSKSLGNVVLAKDMLQQYEPEEIRWFFYQKYYGSPIDFSNEIMNDVKSQYHKIINQINIFKTKYYLKTHLLPESIMQFDDKFIAILNDDLNFANAISYIQNQTKELNKYIDNNNFQLLEKIYQFLLGDLWILGIHFKEIHTKQIIDLINEWNHYVELKDFTKSDELRKVLMDKKVM